MDGMGPGPWEWILIASILPAVLEAAIISVGVYLAVRFGFNRMTSRINSSGSESGDAMEIVRRRYAKGEIPRSEYEQLREDLETVDLDEKTSEAQKERTR